MALKLEDESVADEGYVYIIDHQMVKYEKSFMKWEKMNDMIDRRSNDSKIPIDDRFSAHYDRYFYKDIHWFICNHSDCEHTETDEQRIVTRVKLHSPEITDTIRQITDNSRQARAGQSRANRCFKAKALQAQHKYRCEWTECAFGTSCESAIARHVNRVHINPVHHKCSQPDCGKTFANIYLLRYHEAYHLCGFRIVGKWRTVEGLCNKYNIRKHYRRERLAHNSPHKFMYRCLASQCAFVSTYLTSMETHVHGQHVCPFRSNLNLIAKDK